MVNPIKFSPFPERLCFIRKYMASRTARWKSNWSWFIF